MKYALLILILTSAVYAQEDSAALYLNKGTAYYNENAFVLAEAMYKKALSFDSTIAEAWQSLGVLYYAEGKTVEAVEAWQKALLDTAYYDRKRIYLFLAVAVLFAPDIAGEQDFLEATFDYINKALETDSGFAEAYYWRGRAWELVPNIDSAITCYEKTTKLDKSYAPAWNNWGIILFIQNKRGSGSADKFGKAVFIEPDNAVYHYNLALSYLKLGGHIYEAHQEMKKAIKLNPYVQTEPGAIKSTD